MPRAANGVYSLPSGNPVVTGTTIASTWANTTLSDLATAMTDSLDRSGLGAMLASLGLFAGSKSTPGLSWAVETNSGLYRNAAGDFRYAIAATDIFQITAAGITLFGAGSLVVPGTFSAGSLSTAGTIVSTATFSAGGSSGNSPFQSKSSLPAFTLINTSAAADAKTWEILATATDLVIRTNIDAGTSTKTILDVTRSAGVLTAITIGDATDKPNFTINGRVGIPAPASGTTLSINGLNGAQMFVLASTGATNGFAVGWNVGISANTWNLFSQGTDPIILGTAGSANLSFSTNSVNRFFIDNLGRVNVNAPSSTGSVPGGSSLNVLAPNTASASFGLFVEAGTNSSDNAVLVNNAANSLNLFKVRGDGIVQATDQGGTLQDLGWRGTPINAQSTNYTLQISDRGKTVTNSAVSSTTTVPASVFTAGDVVTIAVGAGGTITIAQGSGMTLLWAGNGSTTGSRTLTGSGIATLLFIASNAAFISGAGLS
jgi:hypothetical protein